MQAARREGGESVLVHSAPQPNAIKLAGDQHPELIPMHPKRQGLD